MSILPDQRAVGFYALIFIAHIDSSIFIFQARQGLVTDYISELRRKTKKSAHKSPLALYEKQLTGANACVLIICAFYTVSTAKILLPKGFKSRQNLFYQDSEKNARE